MYPQLVDFYGKLVARNTSHTDPMGHNGRVYKDPYFLFY